MVKRLQFLLLFLVVGCIESYEFVVRDESPALVVEGFLSDKSFNETLTYPSDGRYFSVKLSLTGDVTNIRPVPVSGAVVQLHTSKGAVYEYTENDGGIYELRDADFKAESGVEYKLRISTPDENIYESAWERLPDVHAPPIGEVSFEEGVAQVYVMEALNWVLREKKVVIANIEVPENTSGETLYYRWTYSPMWVYHAPLISQSDPLYRCWVTDRNYLNTYGLQVDRSGGYQKELFSIQTVRNERLFEKFSVLVTQHAITESNYTFWKEMKDQNEGTAFLDTPPFNLKTNFSSVTGDHKVVGYFGVAYEQATRWYFDKSALSYFVENTMRADCLVVYGPGPPAPMCVDCRGYPFGVATTTRPVWWQQ